MENDMNLNFTRLCGTILTLLTLTIAAMEKTPGNDLLQGIPTLPSDLTAHEKAQLKSELAAYTQKVSDSIRRLAAATKTPLGLLLPDALSIFPERIYLMKEFIEGVFNKAIENNRKLGNPHKDSDLIDQVLDELQIKLEKQAFLKDLTRFHVAVLASDIPMVNEWLKSDIIENQETFLLQFDQVGLHDISAAFLIFFFGNDDLKAALNKIGITLEDLKLGPVQKDLLDAEFERHTKEPWSPSSFFIQHVQSRPAEHSNEIRHLFSLMRMDPRFKKKLQAEQPDFYEWLMKEGIGYLGSI